MKALNTETPSTNIFLVNSNPTTESRTIAKVFGRQHKNVLATLDKLIEEGTISRLEFKPRDYTSRGKKERCYELNEAGFLKAMPFIGGRKSREGQKLLVDEFLRMRKALAKQSKQRESIAFQLMRSEGKDARKLLTDTIKEFIQYAKDHGSRHADRYYPNFTDLVYDSFLIVQPKADKLREMLTPVQLSQLATFELLADQVIKDGIENNRPYKAIFQQVKLELRKYGLGKTKILDL